jgi:hypothetical protein
MKDLAPQISSKSEDSSHQARIPAPVISNIDTNHDANANELARAPPVSDQATLRLGCPGNHDLNPMTSGEDEDVQNLSHMPPEPPESDRANPGAFRMGGQDDDDGNTITFGEEVRSHGSTTHTFQVSARLVEEDPEDYRRQPVPGVEFAVAAVAEGGGNNKCRIYILIGALLLITGIILAATLSTGSPQPGTTPLQRESMISLIQSRSSSTSFSNSFSPQSQALDWILSDPSSSGDIFEDRLVQRFALAALYYSTNGEEWINYDNIIPTSSTGIGERETDRHILFSRWYGMHTMEWLLFLHLLVNQNTKAESKRRQE